MKANEITEQGYYWYQTAERTTIVEFGPDSMNSTLDFWFIGRDDPFDAQELPGEFIGPLKPPFPIDS